MEMYLLNMTDKNAETTLKDECEPGVPYCFFSSRTKRHAGSLFVRIALLAVIFRVLNAYVFGIYLVKGNSMYPSLRDGDLCITYKLEPYTHSEVIAYQAGTAVRFARIAAAGNDTVEITQDGILLINGYQPAEEIFYRTDPGEECGGKAHVQLTVNGGEWYLLNDYREDLSDSRTYGSVSDELLLGKVIFIFRRRGF